MQPRHAVVKNGRLTLDEPSDLPEGHIVLLIPLEELLADMGPADGELGDDIEGVEGSEVAVRFVAAPREWREPKKVSAKALLNELRSI
jgi:hypothetical protein